MTVTATRPAVVQPAVVQPAVAAATSVVATALPVAVELGPRTADAVRRTIEGVLGWQPVDDVTAALVPPAVRLVDSTTPDPSATPAVLVVADGDDPVATAEAVLRLRPVAVAGWPGEDHLATAVATAVAAPAATTTAAVPVVTIGGAGGGVGATTLALALAGLSAWRGTRTLVVSGDRCLLPDGTPTVDPEALTASGLWDRAQPLIGLDAARAVRTTAPAYAPRLTDARVEAVVVDLGVADEVDVLVLRPDAVGRAALGRTTASAAVVVGEGPLPPRELTRAIGGRRRVDVAWSARVARAGLAGRVPTSLPGRLVRSLTPLLPTRIAPSPVGPVVQPVRIAPG